VPFVPDPKRIEVVDEAVAAILRTTPAEKVAMASAAHRTTRPMIQARLQTIHPEWTESHVMAEVARRMLGRTIFDPRLVL
jgi:hypothetical protein